jgi:plastocyanin
MEPMEPMDDRGQRRGRGGRGPPPPPAPRTPSKQAVTVEAVAFQPADLTVNVGDTVVWTNKDPFPHTATAAGAFDSKSIAAGGSWRFTARRAGTFPYVCTLHSNMKGTLQVE